MTAITPKAWNHASPSQIKTFRMCKRKWFWEKIVGLPSPGTAATAFGVQVHALLEAYLKGGQPPSGNTLHGRAALPGLRFLPDPADVRPADVERSFQLLLPGAKAPLHGVIDLVEPQHKDHNGVWLPRVTDHKTTSNFRYMKKEAELLADPQAITYLAELVQLLRREGLQVPDTLAFRHVYYLTDQRHKPEASPVQVRMDLARLDTGCESLVRTIDQMHALSTCTEPAEVPADLTQCGAYGGCPFQYQCARAQAPGATALQAAARFNSKPKENASMSTLAERIAARKASQAAQPTDTPAAPTPTAIAAPAPAAPTAPAAADLRAQAMSGTEAPLTPPQRPTDEALDKMRDMGTGKVEFKPENGINPPDGFPKDEPGVLEEKSRRQPVALPDGRQVSKLNKAELVQAHAELVSTAGSLGKLELYYEKAEPEMSAWVKSSHYGEKPPLVPALRADVELLALIVGGGKLPTAKAPEAPKASLPAPDVGQADDLQVAEQVLFEAEQEHGSATQAHGAATEKLAETRKKVADGDEEAEDALPSVRKAEKDAKARVDAAAERVEKAKAGVEAVKAQRAKEAAALARKAETEAPVAQQQQQTPASSEPECRAGTPSRKEFYVNCAPRVRLGEPPSTYLEIFAEPIQRKVAEQNGVDHYLLLDFNKGLKLVAAQIAFEVGRGELQLPQRLVALRRVMGDPVVEALALLYSEAKHLVVESAG